MTGFPADVQNLIDTAIADRARATKGVVAIASANTALDAARKTLADATQVEVDATNAAASSEPAAIAAFTQWLRSEGDAAANGPAPLTDPTLATV
jgi:hypothetical protein